MKPPRTLRELQEQPYVDGEIECQGLEPGYGIVYLAHISLDWIPEECHRNLTTCYGTIPDLLRELRTEFWDVLRNPGTGEFVSKKPDLRAWGIGVTA